MKISIASATTMEIKEFMEKHSSQKFQIYEVGTGIPYLVVINPKWIGNQEEGGIINDVSSCNHLSLNKNKVELICSTLNWEILHEDSVQYWQAWNNDGDEGVGLEPTSFKKMIFRSLGC
jgi:hypothetical protein